VIHNYIGQCFPKVTPRLVSPWTWLTALHCSSI